MAADKVTFLIGFKGHVSCFSPVQLDDVPLAVKGTGILNGDGTASVDLRLTAYYILTAKSYLAGKLGAPPEPVVGGTAQLKVVNKNGLALTLEYPDTRYTVNIGVDGKKCGAQLIPKLKNKKNIYDIFAIDTEFLCSKFVVEQSSCRVH